MPSPSGVAKIVPAGLMAMKHRKDRSCRVCSKRSSARASAAPRGPRRSRSPRPTPPTKVRPARVHAHLDPAARLGGEGLGDQARAEVPQPYVAIKRTSDQGLAVGREGQGGHPHGVRKALKEPFAAGQEVERHERRGRLLALCGVVEGDGDETSVGGKCEASPYGKLSGDLLAPTDARRRPRARMTPPRCRSP